MTRGELKPLNERLENLRNRHRQYNDTGHMSDALVPMVQHAKDLVQRVKELEEALEATLPCLFLSRTVTAGQVLSVQRYARAILNKKI